MQELVFPDLPFFDKTKVDSCKEAEDYRPIFFEIYKHVGIICSLISCINKKSPGIKNISNAHYGLLTGLLNRCSRLMLANVSLSCNGKFGETTAILDRCIQESAINVRWLCKYEKENSFERFLISGLKSDIELEKNIKQKIKSRDGKILEIEKRMLESINRGIYLSGIDRKDFESFPRLPTFETRIKNLDYENDELPYTVIQRLGSHHVHGTWTSLLTHYLDEDNGELHPNDNLVSIHVNQFISVSLEVLEMLKDFINFITNENDISDYYLKELTKIREYLDSYRIEVRGNDFEEIKA
ncbi:MAG: hypothetical protein JXA68_08250 [Ignavibacteriales bacterium]|nr:hypothetical protein [Ignavibacteriales bacterium]